MTIFVVGAESTYWGGSVWPTPAGLATDWARLADHIAHVPDLSTMVLPSAAGVFEGLDPYGWEPSGALQVSGAWATIRQGTRHQGRYLHLGFADRMSDDPYVGELAGDPLLLGTALRRWAELTGAAYRTSPAVSAIASIRATVARQRRQPRWILQHPGTTEWWTPPGPVNDLRVGPYDPPPPGLHVYDRRAAYLASAGAVELPFGQLRQTGTDADPRCGYYRIRVEQSWLDLFGGADSHGCVWVCHPTLAALAHAGVWYEMIDSWSTSECGRILRPWAERWRDAIDTLPPAKPTFKAGYAQALGGLLAVPRGTVYRPDWRHMIMDHNRAHLVRIILRVHKTDGSWPVAVNVDSLYYLNPVEWIPQAVANIGAMVDKGVTP